MKNENEKLKIKGVQLLFANREYLHPLNYRITVGLTTREHTAVFSREIAWRRSMTEIDLLPIGKRDQAYFEIIYPEIRHSIDEWKRYINEFQKAKK